MVRNEEKWRRTESEADLETTVPHWQHFEFLALIGCTDAAAALQSENAIAGKTKKECVLACLLEDPPLIHKQSFSLLRSVAQQILLLLRKKK